MGFGLGVRIGMIGIGMIEIAPTFVLAPIRIQRLVTRNHDQRNLLPQSDQIPLLKRRRFHPPRAPSSEPLHPSPSCQLSRRLPLHPLSSGEPIVVVVVVVIVVGTVETMDQMGHSPRRIVFVGPAPAMEGGERVAIGFAETEDVPGVDLVRVHVVVIVVVAMGTYFATTHLRNGKVPIDGFAVDSTGAGGFRFAMRVGWDGRRKGRENDGRFGFGLGFGKAIDAGAVLVVGGVADGNDSSAAFQSIQSKVILGVAVVVTVDAVVVVIVGATRG
mmetsp:Transcript_31422/g.66498  ORF Transcript_31422/g.66498 Transcript_31422/m.66498 type:complete len:273 (+) Transcript_31422:890-1708(+)